VAAAAAVVVVVAAAVVAAAVVVVGDELLAKTINPFTHYFMKTFTTRSPMASLKRFFHSIAHPNLALALALGTPIAVSAADIGQTFATPEAAVSALLAAANAGDSNAFRVIFGPVGVEIQNPDRVQAANELKAFNAAVSQYQRLVHASEAKCVLEIGDNAWPFPVPIVKQNGQWFFDTEAGKDEIFNRHIGKNELATLQSVRAYVEAQREYASKDRDGDEVLEYAQMFRSTPGMKDGLYWPQDLDGEISPLGPLVAEAQAQGYGRNPREEGAEPAPFHGYFFKVLTGQGKHAPGGKYSYVINGNMIGGFALAAWPAEYGESGIMAFVVNQQGRVYQKNLGPGTAKAAEAMKAYDPDKTWAVSPD
jgi:hypothetical protein